MSTTPLKRFKHKNTISRAVFGSQLEFSENVLRSFYDASKVMQSYKTTPRAVFGSKMKVSKNVLRSVYDASKVI